MTNRLRLLLLLLLGGSLLLARWADGQGRTYPLPAPLQSVATGLPAPGPYPLLGTDGLPWAASYRQPELPASSTQFAGLHTQ